MVDFRTKSGDEQRKPIRCLDFDERVTTMATAEQIKALIRSHFDKDAERFATIALQMAAHEAKLGHSSIAHEIRALVDKEKFAPAKASPFQKELSDLVLESLPKVRFADLILPHALRERIQRIVKEYKQQDKLKKHGLEHRRKILLAGPPGTGKTMTASVLACELHLPLFTILMDKLVTKFMGETSAKLRQIFSIIQERRGVFLFDEFDAIGAERTRDNDVGEMRRVLNAFLQLLEQDDSDSVIVAATNSPTILDQALFRRFDDVLYYSLPSEGDMERLINNRLGQFKKTDLGLKRALKEAASLSHSEVTQACDNAIKETILSDKTHVDAELLRTMIKERRAAYDNARS